MSPEMERRPNPYVGPRPFEPGEKLYGRERETRELIDLLIAERIVLVHSPSGAGKTSLLQAALIPRLRQRRFNVFPLVRVNRLAQTQVGNRYVLSALDSLEDGLPESDRLDESALASLSLAQYLDQRSGRFGNADSQVLVFDQFEEVLSVDPTDRTNKEAFFAQLGEALLERRRWALFAMREDYMGGLAPYVRTVPTQLSNTFRLDLLTAQAARQAIQQPARDLHVEFTDAAAEKLVDDLRVMQVQQPDGSMTPQLGAYIEPVQLQVVCLRLWDQIKPESQSIVEADVSTIGDVDAALAGYYAERVAVVAQETQVRERAIREWFDRQLITEQGIRSQVLFSDEPPQPLVKAINERMLQRPEGSGGLANRAVWALVNAHLVRAEQRRGATWFELAHDRLIKPIRQYNAEWFDANLSQLQRQADLWSRQSRHDGFLVQGTALDEMEKWAQANAAELTEVEREYLQACRYARARKRNRNIRWLVIGLSTMLLMSIATTCFTFQQFWVVSEHRAVAQTQEAVAYQSRAEALKQKQVSDSLRLAANSTSNREQNFPLGLLLGLEALRLDDNLEGRSNLLDVLTSKPQLSSYLHGHTDYVSRVAFSPDGKTLASSSADKTIILWDVATRQRIGQPLTGHTSSVISVAFSPDGKTLASGSDDNTIVLWDVTTRQRIGQPLTGHTDSVFSAAFSPDGKTLVSGSADKTIILWDVATRQQIGQPLTGHTSSVISVAFSPEGKTLASSSADKTIILWDVATRQRIGQPLTGHTDSVFSAAFSPDGKTLASSSADKTIVLWDVATRQRIGQPLTGHMDSVFSAAFSPDGKTLASASNDRTIILWDIATHQKIGQPLTGHTGYVFSAAFSPDGKTLASGSADKTIVLWDVATRQRIGQPLTGHTSSVISVAFSPDGKTLASGSADKTIVLWDVATRQRIGQPLTGRTDYVSSVAFSPDGKTLASGSDDKTIVLWDVATRQRIGQPLTGHSDLVMSVAFSPDGKMLASGSADKTIILWDAGTRQMLGQSLKGHTSVVFSVAFGPDGKTLASASNDRTIILWDIATHQKIGQPLTGRTDYVSSVAFSPEGKTLASGSADKTIVLWDVATRQRIGQPLTGHTSSVISVAFSPDGKTLASASADETIVLWDMDVESWKARACYIANRNLTREEWTHYIDPDPSTYRATCPGLPLESK